MLFFRNLLDWLVQERDLLELQNKVGANRSMTFLEQNDARGETDQEFGERLRGKTIWLMGVNAAGPAALFLGLGLILLVLRRSRKRAFLNQL